MSSAVLLFCWCFWNLRAARELKAWTQTEATEHLAEYGINWSVASLSDAERSWQPDSRNREFTADDLVTFSLAFGLPLTWWFLPSTTDDTGDMTFGVAGGTMLDRTEILDLIFAQSAVIDERLTRLATSPVFATTERVRLTEHLETQEHHLRQLLNDVVATQEFLEAEARDKYWMNEGDDDG